MNQNKICFIICTNNKFLIRECRLYIDQLNIPPGYEVETIEIWDAKGMAEGYNRGMAQSDAKYKIYLHQDVLIINHNFLEDILLLFRSNPNLGMLGMVGNSMLSKEVTPWGTGAKRIGDLYADVINNSVRSYFGTADRDYQNVIVIDGLLMATQYDLTWRADLFQGWDMYDLSQSMEFWRAGYDVAVPHMECPWVLHDNDILNLDNYEKWKAVFRKEYRKDYLCWNSKMNALETSNRKVIYQILSKYDSSLRFPYPPVYEETADYICFTDREKLTSNYWKIISFDEMDEKAIQEYLSPYDECYELKSNQIQVGPVFSEKKMSFSSVITLPSFQQLGFLGFDESKIISVKDENGNYKYEKNPVYTTGKYEGRDYLLTIGMPVSNQIATIDRCLSHIKPLLDRLDAELVIADTGSTDGTIEVCRSYGARVVNFPWCNNMSAARNTVIRNSKGLWYLSIDDDEWFEDTEDIYDFFKSERYKQYDLASYVQRNYMDLDGKRYIDFTTVRMVKITEDTHFEGRIHDALTNGQLENQRICNLHSYAHHYGFARDDMEKITEKCKRNLSGLIYDMYEFPDDLRYNYQFANEFQVMGNYKPAIAYFFRGVSMSRELGVYVKEHVLNLIGCFAKAKGKALFDVIDLLKDSCIYTAAEKAFLYFSMEEKAVELKEPPEKILSICEKVEECVEEYKKDIEGNRVATVRGLHICENLSDLMDNRITAFFACCKMENVEGAIEQFDKIIPEEIIGNERVYVNHIFRSNKEIFDYAINHLSPLLCNQWADMMLEKAAKIIVEEQNKAIPDNDQKQLSFYKFQKLLEKLTISTLQKVLPQISERECLLQELCRNNGLLSVQEYFCLSLLLKEKIMAGQKTDLGYLEVFLLYCEATGKFSEKYYHPSLLMNDVVSPIPVEQKAAYHIYLALSDTSLSLAECIRHLKSAVQIFPGFKSEISQILDQLKTVI